MSKPRLLLLMSLAVAILLGWLGRAIPVSSLWGSFDALRNTAAIVFGVTGVWITVLYPKALDTTSKSIQSESLSAKDRVERARALILPITISTTVIAITLLVQPVALVLKQYTFEDWLIPMFRGGLFGVFCLLTLLQLASVILTIWPVHVAKGEMVVQTNRDQHKSQLTKNSRHQ